MKKLYVMLLSALLGISPLMAQDTEDRLIISGSVDTYYNYSFSGTPQINTSFTDTHNSFSIGMVDLAFEKTVGKASFVGEVAFGPRADASAPGAVQQLYVAFAASDLITISGGFFSTYVGYEVISPVGNFNYSTSYLFSNGPFQQGGVKIDFAFTERFGMMLGVFNEFDSYTNTDGGLDLGAQFYFMPVDGWDMYLNFVSSDDSGTEIDLTTTFTTGDWLFGLNAARRSRGNFFNTSEGQGINFHGVAGYVNWSIVEIAGLGLRVEYFDDENGAIFDTPDMSTSVTAATLSANIGKGPLKLIPEFRYDFASNDVFVDNNGNASSSAGQFTVAAVFGF